MRLFNLLSSLTLVSSPLAFAAAIPANDVRQPVVLELFTSEGCSSCPPADALLQKLDQSQPIPVAFLIVLSEHVDYWDRLGWKDSFSSPLFSRRQQGYVSRFQLESAYTPQVVVDGNAEALGSDAGRIQNAVRTSLTGDKYTVEITQVFKNDRGTPQVHVQVDAPRKAGKHDVRLMLALAENSAISDVRRGENRGRTLSHVAVVRSLVDFGKIDPSGNLSADVPLTGELAKWEGKRLVAFVQSPQYGRIQGAAVRLLSVSAAR
jgi:hypothetical protein